MKIKKYKGFEYDADDVKLMPKTKKVLDILKRDGHVGFERDDSQNGYETMRQLVEIADINGIFISPDQLLSQSPEENKSYKNFPYDIILVSGPEFIHM